MENYNKETYNEGVQIYINEIDKLLNFHSNQKMKIRSSDKILETLIELKLGLQKKIKK